MTRERLNHLLDLIDEVNSKVYVSASLSHGRNDDDEIFVSLFYLGEKKYKAFSTCEYSSNYDPDLERGEAFLHDLLAQAQINRRANMEAWKNGIYQG